MEIGFLHCAVGAHVGCVPIGWFVTLYWRVVAAGKKPSRLMFSPNCILWQGKLPSGKGLVGILFAKAISAGPTNRSGWFSSAPLASGSRIAGIPRTGRSRSARVPDPRGVPGNMIGMSPVLSGPKGSVRSDAFRRDWRRRAENEGWSCRARLGRGEGNLRGVYSGFRQAPSRRRPSRMRVFAVGTGIFRRPATSL